MEQPEYIFNPNLAATVEDEVISPLRYAPRFQAITCAFAEAAQDIEDTAHELALGFNIISPAPWALELWGRLVDEPRGGLTADEHLRFIRAKFVALRSQGDGTSIANVVRALFPNDDYRIIDMGYNAIQLQMLFEVEPSEEVQKRTVRLVRLAKAAGVEFQASYGLRRPYFAFDGDPHPNAAGFGVGYYFSVFSE